MAKIIIVQGYAGSGKSTHCLRLEQEGYLNLSFQHISAGEKLRGIRTGTKNSLYENIINSPYEPSPLPNEVVNGVIMESIQESTDSNTISLIDGYPRHPAAVEIFRDELVNNLHHLLGTIALQVSIETSVRRILDRGTRAGEKIQDGNLREFALKRYDYDNNITRLAIESFAQLAPLEIVDANSQQDIVYEKFRHSISNLINYNSPLTVL